MSFAKNAGNSQSPAGYYYGREAVSRLEGGSPTGGGQRDIPLPKNGFGTMYGTGQPKTAFDRAFSDEISKIAVGLSRTKAIRLSRSAAPSMARRIKGIRRTFRKHKLRVR